jgi:DNA-binding response OmpR family regulator
MKILLVEDEPKLNQFVKKGLEQQGYQVDSVLHGSEAIDLAAVTRYDLIILDLMLPGQSGLDILENLKRFKINSPVMIMSALSGSEHVIEGLDKGAIDYVKKPFDFGEFLARVRVITRKGESKQATQLIIDSVKLDLLARKATQDDSEIILTKREFTLLEYLMNNCNRVLSKTEIAEKIWEINFDNGSNVIEVHMSALRKKINGHFIKTKVGLGYYIEGVLIKK